MAYSVNFLKGTLEKFNSLKTQGLLDKNTFYHVDEKDLYFGDKLLTNEDQIQGALIRIIANEKSIKDIFAELSQIQGGGDGSISEQLAALREDLESKISKKMDIQEVKATTQRVKYEIFSKPLGSQVKYFDKEIRVLCPKNTAWIPQTVGPTGNSNMYYMGFKAYAPVGAVGFKEGDQGIIKDEMFDFKGDFAGTDGYGRNYSICWLALASYNSETQTWNYFGEKSTKEKYIGWTYVVEWYDVNGNIIESDSIKINLANEECYYNTEPYYVGSILKEAKNYTDQALAWYEV